MTEDEIVEEARLMKTEEDWPLWPVLPVKHVDRNDPDHPKDQGFGIVTAGLSGRPTYIYLIKLFQLKPKIPLSEQLADVPHLEFSSTEDAVRAGWIGD